MKQTTIGLLLLLLAGLASAEDFPGLHAGATWKDGKLVEGEPRSARELDNARLIEDVPYLDDSRDTLTWDNCDTLKYKTRMNVYIPEKGDGPFPAILYVHGGSYTGGGKDPLPHLHWAVHRNSNGMQMGIDKGYVVISYAYILGRGIHPQVQRDFKECIRHLRANAEKYSIDPNRIAAVGASAGGWLVTSAGLTTADDFGYQSKGQVRNLSGYPKGFEIGRRSDKKFNERGPYILTNFDELRPRHPEVSSRLNALVFDFAHQMQATTPDDPAMLTFKGQGAKAGRWEKEAQPGDLRLVELTQRQARGKPNFHMPDPTQMVEGKDGTGQVSLNERCFQFLDEVLKGESARTPAAEARPNTRFFEESVDVTFAVASPATKVHYTLDGSEPTTDSPVARKPLKLTETTTVKFISVADGMRPSGVARAHFLKGKPLPEVTGPKELPVAKVGQSYKVQFAAEGAKHWFAAMQNHGWGAPKVTIFRVHDHYEKREQFMLNCSVATIGLKFDIAAGKLTGTPNRPGTYVLQVAAARDSKSPGGWKTWTLVVLPSDRGTSYSTGH